MANALKVFKFKPGEDYSNYRILPPDTTGPTIIDFVDTDRYHLHRTGTLFIHKDQAIIGACDLCDHEKETKFAKFRGKMMAEAETEL